MASIGGVRGQRDNSRRRYPGVGGRSNNPVRYAEKVKEGAERQAYWSSLSPREQLSALDRRLGEGAGAKRQRERLMASLTRQSGRPDGRTQPVPAAEVAPEKSALKAKERRAQEKAVARNVRGV